VKIIKKYDKVMHEEHLEEWVSRLANEPFVCSNEAQILLDTVSESVSRDKLVEWERVAKETIGKNEDDIIPQVKVKSLIVCIGLFLVSLAVPDPLGNGDGAAARCLSLLILVVSMWITQAIPYFATGLLVPVLVTVLGVLKTSDGKGVLSTHEASQFVMDHMTNHTTVRGILCKCLCAYVLLIV
jgi:phosphate transporter